MEGLDKIAESILVEEGYVRKVINGDEYIIKLLPAMQGISLFVRLTKAITPLIGMWADGEKKEDFVLPEEDNLFTELALLFTSKLDDINIEEVTSALMNELTFNGKVVDFDEHFRANYCNLLLLLEEAIKENFGSFFVDYLKAKGINFQEGLAALKTRMQETT